MFDKKYTSETRQRISDAIREENHPMFGRKHSPETLEQMSTAKQGENNPMFGNQNQKDQEAFPKE
jgi:hypothetical protein